MNSDNKVQFLYQSIQDIQNTIRSIDNKIFGVLVILVLPFSLLEEFHEVFATIINSNFCIGYIFSGLFVLSWLASLFFSFRAILAIDNPINHISNANGNGYFYGAKLFDLKTKIFRFKDVQSKKDLTNYSSEIKSDWDIVNELVFEQMKLVYIRDVKMQIQKLALFTLASTITTGLLSWVIYKMIIS
ncbi:MAG: hypothetical protein WEA58_13155 [Balneolaceae bacterium]